MRALSRSMLALAGLLLVAPLVDAAPARADFRVCNRTKYLLNVAVGYGEKGDFETEGWWSVTASSCVTPIRGTLKSRFVYLYAADIDANGVAQGTVSMCIERRRFHIRGITDCWRRGFEAASFAEIDTLSAQNWTTFLGEAAAPR